METFKSYLSDWLFSEPYSIPKETTYVMLPQSFHIVILACIFVL